MQHWKRLISGCSTCDSLREIKHGVETSPAVIEQQEQSGRRSHPRPWEFEARSRRGAGLASSWSSHLGCHCRILFLASSISNGWRLYVVREWGADPGYDFRREVLVTLMRGASVDQGKRLLHERGACDGQGSGRSGELGQNCAALLCCENDGDSNRSFSSAAIVTNTAGGEAGALTGPLKLVGS